MNILLLNWRDIRHPDAGGSEFHMHEISRRWANMGHEVTLVCTSFQGARHEEIIDGVRILRKGNRYSVYLLVILFIIRNSHKYDVVFESVNTIPFLAPLFTNTPVVSQIYSIENTKVLADEISFPRLPTLVLGYLISFCIRKIYHGRETLTISQSSKTLLEKNGFPRVHVAYPGLSENFRKALAVTLESNRPNSTIVCLGRLKKYKGVQDVIRAVGMLRRKIPTIKLLIIGKGDYEPELRGLASDLQLNDVIEFCGFVSEEDKAILLKSSSLYVCTSRDEGGWTIASVESMAAGNPVIVTKSQVDVVDSGLNGFILSSESPSEIADKIAYVLQNESLWGKLSLNARIFSDKFTWDQTSSISLSVLMRASNSWS